MSLLAVEKELFCQNQDRQPEPPKPEFDLKSAGEVLKEAASRKDRPAELAAAEAEANAKLEQAQAEFNAEWVRIQEEKNAARAFDDRASRARSFAIRAATPPREIEVLHEQGKAYQRKIGQLKSRYGIHAVTMKAPGDTEDVKQLATLEEQIKYCQSKIREADKKKPSRWAGHSNAELRLPGLLRERDDMQQQVAKYRREYGHWQEIQAVKAEAEECRAKKEQLQRQHEEAAIAAAIAAAK